MATAADDRTRYTGAAGLERSRRSWTVVAVLLAIGVVIGAVGGALVGGGPRQYQALAEVSILPDSTVDANLYPNALQLDTSTYIQGELIRLNGKAFAQNVRDQLELRHIPTFAFAQVDQTAIVSVTATAATRVGASEITKAALSTYRADRSRSLLSTISRVSTRTTARIAMVGRQLRAASVPASSTAATRGALQTEYSSLLSEASTLDQDRAEVASVVTNVQATRTSIAASSGTSAILLGAVLGALVAVLALLGARKLNPTIGTMRTLAELGLPVLLPSMPRSSGPHGAVRARTAARALGQQLSRHALGEPLIVTGATSGVGASYVAASIARTLGESLVGGSAVLVSAAGTTPPDGVELVALDADSPYSGFATIRWARSVGRPVVIDAPSLDTSDVALRLLDEGGVGLLVVGRGMSHPIDVFGAGQLLRTIGPRVAGVVLNDVPLAAGNRVGRIARRLTRRRPAGRDAASPTSSIPLSALVDVSGTSATVTGYRARRPAAMGRAGSSARLGLGQGSRRRVPTTAGSAAPGNAVTDQPSPTVAADLQ